MKYKFIEIRDRMTFIPALAIEMSGAPSVAGDWLMRRSGYRAADFTCIVLISLQKMECKNNYYDWGDRTMSQAHKWVEENWNGIECGSVVDVEYILGETTHRKVSERFD